MLFDNITCTVEKASLNKPRNTLISHMQGAYTIYLMFILLIALTKLDEEYNL
jgi:hypothetical protein